MQMKKKIIAVFGILLLLFVLIAGIQIEKRHSQNKIKTFTAFFSVLGEPRDEENEIKKLIAQKTGVSCEEIWLTVKQRTQQLHLILQVGNTLILYPEMQSF